MLDALIKMAAVASVLLTLGLVLLMAGVGFVIETVRRQRDDEEDES